MSDTDDTTMTTTKQPATGALMTREQRVEWLSKIVPKETLESLNTAHEQFFGALSDTSMSKPERAMLAAVALVKLREALSGPVLRDVIVPLMNSPIGFDTDKNPRKGYNRGEPYPPETVLECAAEAFLHGLPLTGNCFNIIGGNMYPRKEGFELLLGQECKFTAKCEVPEIGESLFKSGGYVTIPVAIQYKLHTDPDDADNRRFHGTYNCRLTKFNAVAVENLEGKAKRKAYRDLWAHITGNLLGDADEPGEASVHQVGSHYGDSASADAVQAGAGKTEPQTQTETDSGEASSSEPESTSEAEPDGDDSGKKRGGLFS